MSNTLEVTTTLVNDHWDISAQLGSGATIPRDIFIYENTGTTSLGEFFGTCAISDLTKFQVYTGEVVPIFGNRYLRHDTANISIYKQEDLAEAVTILLKNVTNFKLAYLSTSSTTQTFVL